MPSFSVAETNESAPWSMHFKFRLEAGTARRYPLTEMRVSTLLEPAGGARL